MRNFAADFGVPLRSGYALPARQAEIGKLQPAEDPLILRGILSKQSRPLLSLALASGR
jgi:hypothetical protein